MWINKKYYKELLDQLDRYEKGDVAIITGKYFFAEKTYVKGVWLWAIYRKDFAIKPEKSALVFDCLTVENAERLVSHFDETMDTLLERKSTLLVWLMNAHKMAKRVYVPGECVYFCCKCGSTHGDTHTDGCDGIERCNDCNRTKEQVQLFGHEMDQLIDGAVPMWWINQEIERIMKMEGKKNADDENSQYQSQE